MLSRENVVILVCTVVAVATFLLGSAFTNVSDTVLLGVLLFVSIIVPVVVNNYLDVKAD